MAGDEDLVYDETLPTHVRVEACMRLIRDSMARAAEFGEAYAAAKASYYGAKDRECFALLDAGHANTFIQTVIKGRPSASAALRAYDMAEVEYKNANEAIQAYKLVLRVLEAELEREWNDARRM